LPLETLPLRVTYPVNVITRAFASIVTARPLVTTTVPRLAG
jgi:hypothetical protein